MLGSREIAETGELEQGAQLQVRRGPSKLLDFRCRRMSTRSQVEALTACSQITN